MLVCGTLLLPDSIRSMTSLLGTLALVGFATWLGVMFAREARKRTEAAEGFVRRHRLEFVATGDEAGEKFPDAEVWQAYRGQYEGAPIWWLKAWIGSAQRGGIIWIAAVELRPAFEEPFAIEAWYSGDPQRAPHPALPANRHLSWRPEPWLRTWLDALPADSAAALKRFLSDDRHSLITNRRIWCVVNELADEGSGAADVVFARMVALARLLT